MRTPQWIVVAALAHGVVGRGGRAPVSLAAPTPVSSTSLTTTRVTISGNVMLARIGVPDHTPSCWKHRCAVSLWLVDQDDVRVFPRAIEHDVFAVRRDVERPERTLIGESGELTGALRGEMEQPEIQ